MVKKICVFMIFIIYSCISINNKSNLLNINDIGIKNNELLINKGYYYYIKKYNNQYLYYKNQYGGYEVDSTKKYDKYVISPVILYLNGSAIFFNEFSGMQENLYFNYKEKCNLEDDNSIKGALKHFECFIHNKPKEYYSIFNKRIKLNNLGIYLIDKSNIKIQKYNYQPLNGQGYLYLLENMGYILNDSCFVIINQKNYNTKKEYRIDTLKYHLRFLNNLPKNENYILKNKSKFWKDN